MAERMQLTRLVAASPEEVFEAWTRAEILGRWFAPGLLSASVPELDARPGGRFRVEMHDPSGVTHIVSGTYREVEPNQRLVFTWAWEGVESPETLVSVELRPQGADTELVLTHEGFPNVAFRDQHLHGWTGSTEKLAGLFARVPATGEESSAE